MYIASARKPSAQPLGENLNEAADKFVAPWPVRTVRRVWRRLPQGLRHDVGPRLGVVLDRAIDRSLGIRNGHGITYADEAQRARTKHRDPAPFQSTPYFSIWRALPRLSLGPTDVFCDLGCGSGRVVLAAARVGVGRAVGIDCDPTVIDRANENLGRARFLSRSCRVQFSCKDAADYQFVDETVLFLFNPFGAGTLQNVLENLRASLQRRPRAVTIAYRTPRHGALLAGCDWLEPVPETLSSSKTPEFPLYVSKPSA